MRVNVCNNFYVEQQGCLVYLVCCAPLQVKRQGTREGEREREIVEG